MKRVNKLEKIIRFLKFNLVVFLILLLTACSETSTTSSDSGPPQDVERWFPNGTTFSSIKNIDEQSQAWAVCAALSPVVNVEQPAGVVDFTLITTIVILSDSAIKKGNKKSSLQSMLAAQELILVFNKKIQSVAINLEMKALTTLLTTSIRVCNSNASEGEKILNAYDSAKNEVGSKEYFLSLEFAK